MLWMLREPMSFRGRRGRRNGFTLVELIVTLLIVGIVLSVAAGFIVFGGNFLNRTEQHATDKRLAEDSADYIKERLLHARSIDIVRAARPPVDPPGGDILYIGRDTDGDGRPDRISNTGRLYYMRSGEKDPVDIFGDDYRGCELSLAYSATVTEAGEGSIYPFDKFFELTTAAIRDGKQTYYSEKTFRLYETGSTSPPMNDIAISSWNAGGGGSSFYLVFNTAAAGYVLDSLLARYDAIDNTLDAAGTLPQHDPGSVTRWQDISGNGCDMRLSFTNNPSPIRAKSIYFDGADDFGVITSLDLSEYSSITVEVCLREEEIDGQGMLFEHSLDAGSHVAGFSAMLNDIKPPEPVDPGEPEEEGDPDDGSDDGSDDGGDPFDPGDTGPDPNGNVNTVMGFGDASGVRDHWYDWSEQTMYFTTIANSFSMKAGEEPHIAWVNGNRVAGISGNDPFASSRNFANYPLYLASRGGTELNYKGEIAAVRVYGRELSDAEAAQNAAMDAVRFGG
jgi:prepilin-type N-terminal cleavage/methylation domain-containing protein